MNITVDYISKGDIVNCKYLKIRSKKYKYFYYCSILKKETQSNDCKNCEYKEYKNYKPLRQKSSKQTKIEKDRFSLFTDDLSKCYFCDNKKDDMHEIFSGRNRANSMRFGLCLPICRSCHIKCQNDPLFNEIWHIRGQLKFEEVYPGLAFLGIFKKNYK